MLILLLAVRGYFLQEPRLLTYRPLKLTRKVSFVFPMKVSEEISPLSFHKLFIYIMHLKYDKSERNSSDHHMTYIGKTNHRNLKRSVTIIIGCALI